MGISSENLYEYINNLEPDEKVKFKVYYIGDYVTQIYWNGKSFEWDTGTFTSEAFFNPAYVFEVIGEDGEDKGIENNFQYVYGCDNDMVDANFENIRTTLENIINVINEMREDK